VSDDQDFLELSGIHSANISAKTELSSGNFSLLKGLSPLSLRILNDASRLLYVSKGVEIMHEGDNPHDLYFIKKGKVAIARSTAGQQKVAAVLKEGDLFGEFGLLRKKPRVASVFTTEESILIRVKSESVHQVLQADAEFKARLERLLSLRLLSSFFFSHPVFSALPDVIRSALSNELQVEYIQANERIFSQGNKPNGVCLIISGEVEVSHVNKKGQDILVEVRRNSDVLGEIATKDGTALAYSATTASHLDMLKIDSASMKRLHDAYPDVYKRLETYISKRASQTASRLKDINK